MTSLLAVAAAAPFALIPRPASVVPGTGVFELTDDLPIVAGNVEAPTARMLRRALEPATGFDFPIVRKADGRAVRLRLDRSLGRLGREGYRLEVTAKEVVIRASEAPGLFYGCQTLLQLLPPEIDLHAPLVREWSIPAVTIEDWPRFGWRGAMIDSARHFTPREAIFKFLDEMARHKLNVFHWHLTDDNGWRLEIRRYPKLAEVGSKRDFSQMNPAMATRSINQRPEGYYSQADVREIVRYAAERHITVVPEIELPGHSAAIIAAYPDLGNRVQIEAAGGDASFLGMDNVLNVEDTTVRFLQNVLDEVLELFPSRFIHIGGDEVWKEPWKRNPRAQALMKARGLKTEEELQSWFIRQFDAYLDGKARRLIGWDEILEGGLAPGAAVMSWRGMEGGVDAAKAGHDVVMAPTSHTYFDYYQSQVPANEPKAIGGYVSLETAYAFEPVPPSLTPEEARRVLGAQGQLWTEFIPHPRHLEYMAFPRLCALAEVVWSPKEARDWTDFQKRLETHFVRLRTRDVNFREPRPDPVPAATWRAGELSETATVREWNVSATAVALEGDVRVIFSYSHGLHRLEMKWVELEADGKVLTRIDRAGATGTFSSGNEYRFTLPKGAKRVLIRAEVRTDGGTDSNGAILLLPTG